MVTDDFLNIANQNLGTDMLKIYNEYIPKFLILLSISILSACSGESQDSTNGSLEASIISGRVIDDAGLALENVLVSTVPPTERRLTDSGGFFQISDSVFEGEVYDVHAQQEGFTASSQRISVTAGGSSTVDFILRPAVNGLAASVANLQISGSESVTFLLSSTINNTQYNLRSTTDRFIVSPAAGTIDRNERDIITVSLRDPANTARVTGQLIGDITNSSGQGFDLDLIGNPGIADPEPLVDSFLDGDNSDNTIISDSGNSADTSTLGDNTNTINNTSGNNSNTIDNINSADNSNAVDDTTSGDSNNDVGNIIPSDTTNEIIALTRLLLNNQAGNDFARRDGLSVSGAIENNSLLINSVPGPNGADNACAADSFSNASWYWQLPLKFTGDITNSIGSNLDFSLRHDRSPNTSAPLVILIGANGTTYTHNENAFPGSEWANYSISLVADNFVISGSNTRPSDAEFKQTLTSIVDLLILGDFSTGTNTDEGCISQVSLQQEETSTSYGFFESFTDTVHGFAGVNGTTELRQIGAGGAPGAHLCLEDTNATNREAFWAASDSFLGDWSAQYGEEIHYRVSASSVSNSTLLAESSVLISGSGITLIANFPSTPSQYWHNRRVPLLPEHWRILIDSVPTDRPSETIFRQVLSDVNQLHFPADFNSGTNTDSACLDSVGVTGSFAAKAPVVYSADFDFDSENWSISDGANDFSFVQAGGVPGGHICAEDAIRSDRWQWIAPADLLGQINSSSNELTFYRKNVTNNTTSESVLLQSSIGNLVFTENFAPNDSWKATRAPLQSNRAWVFEGTSQIPSVLEFQQALDTLTSVNLYGDFDNSTNTDDSCLDSVELR